MGNQQDRRKFVTGTLAAGAAIVTGAIPKLGRACPVVYDSNGKRILHYCITDWNEVSPVFWEYTYTACDGSDSRVIIGPAGSGTGDCSNDPKNDPNCSPAHEVIGWEEDSVLGVQFHSKLESIEEVRRAYIKIRKARAA